MMACDRKTCSCSSSAHCLLYEWNVYFASLLWWQVEMFNPLKSESNALHHPHPVKMTVSANKPPSLGRWGDGRVLTFETKANNEKQEGKKHSPFTKALWKRTCVWYWTENPALITTVKKTGSIKKGVRSDLSSASVAREPVLTAGLEEFVEFVWTAGRRPEILMWRSKKTKGNKSSEQLLTKSPRTHKVTVALSVFVLAEGLGCPSADCCTHKRLELWTMLGSRSAARTSSGEKEKGEEQR